MEVFKQILYSFVYETTVIWSYTWYAFPFQICSAAMYMAFLTSIIWKGRIQKALDACIVIAMMGGTTALFYPADAFHTTYIFICNQTMIHHGIMLVMGVVLMVTRLELTHKTFFLYGLPLYYLLVIIALVMDLCFYYFYSRTTLFNMFYISPFWDGPFPVIGPLRITAYPVYFLIFLVMSSIYGYLLFFVGIITKYILNKIGTYVKNRKENELKERCLCRCLFFIVILFSIDKRR
jgi:hypothetical protein